MSWVSERNLVSAISNAGGFGVIACGAMTPELLDTEIAATRALTGKPFGVNLITMHPQLFDLIGVCAKHGVTHVVLAGGIPPKGSVEAIKGSGAKVICFAPTLALAKKLLRQRDGAGADALVIVTEWAQFRDPAVALALELLLAYAGGKGFLRGLASRLPALGHCRSSVLGSSRRGSFPEIRGATRLFHTGSHASIAAPLMSTEPITSLR